MSWRRSSAPYSGDKHPLNPGRDRMLPKSSQNHETHIRKIMIIEEANKRKLQDCELRNFGEVFEKHPTRNIIDFESAGEALKKVDFDDEQNRGGLMERSGVPSRLPVDWLWVFLAVVFFVVLLLGLVGGVIASWRF